MTKAEIFDKIKWYRQNGTDKQKECANSWGIAIGLQDVDKLSTSSYLHELALKNIEGELSMEEVDELLDKYYDEKRKKKAAWKEYETYTRIDNNPDPEGSKMGRPI